MSETNIENIRFKNITNLNELASILPTDRFLVARKDLSTLGYTTYLTLWNNISSDLVDKAKLYNVLLGLITTLNGMKINSVTSAIAGNVGYQLLLKINSISSINSSSFVKLSSTSRLVVSANTYFKNISCDTYSIVAGNECKVCNLSNLYYFTMPKFSIRPIFSTLFKNQKLDKDTGIILTDLIPLGYSSTKFTFVAKFNRSDTTSTNAKTVSFSIQSTTTDFTPTITKVKEIGVTLIKKGTLQYYLVMYFVDTKDTSNNNKLYIKFCNGDYANISFSLSIFDGDVSSYKDSM